MATTSTASLPPTTPKVLAFDVFGTVVDWHGTIVAEINRDYPQVPDPSAFALAWRSGYAPAMAATMASGQFRLLDDLHLQILREIAPQHGLAALSEDQLRALNRVWHRLQPWPDAVAGLQRLRSKFVLSTLSNGGINLLARMAKNGGFDWDVILCAEVFQAYKPDERVYKGAARVLEVEDGEVMMVATHHSDLDAAQDAGLQTVYITRPDEWGVGGGKENESGKSERHPLHMKDLGELADYFGC